MLCDVCNAAVTQHSGEQRIAPATFIRLMEHGFGLDETNISMLTDAGLPRLAAEAALKATYRLSQSDWQLSPDCVAKAMPLMNTWRTTEERENLSRASTKPGVS